MRSNTDGPRYTNAGFIAHQVRVIIPLLEIGTGFQAKVLDTKLSRPKSWPLLSFAQLLVTPTP